MAISNRNQHLKTQYQANIAEGQGFFGESSTSNCTNSPKRGNDERITDIDDNNSDDSEEIDYPIKSEIEITEVIANYSHHNDALALDNELQANNGGSIINENQPTSEVKIESEEENDQNKSKRKHQSDRTAMKKMQPLKKSKVSEMANSSQANDDEVAIISDDEANWEEYKQIILNIRDQETVLANLKEREESLKKRLGKNRYN